MSWMLNVSGHIPDDLDARELEHRLTDELKAVLSRPEFGTAMSWFRGIHVASSSVHRAPEGTAPVASAAIVESEAAEAEAAVAKPARGAKGAAVKATGA